MTENLKEGLLRELSRNRKLLNQYRAIGPAGPFGAHFMHFIEQSIADAEEAIDENDVVAMERAYEKLEENT